MFENRKNLNCVLSVQTATHTAVQNVLKLSALMDSTHLCERTNMFVCMSTLTLMFVFFVAAWNRLNSWVILLIYYKNSYI